MKSKRKLRGQAKTSGFDRLNNAIKWFKTPEMRR